MKPTIDLANKCVILHALLEQAQSLMDELKGTNVYSHELKQTGNSFSKQLEKKIATWYNIHIPKSEIQVTYLQVSKDLENATNALLQSNPATYKILPAFISALEAGEIETK